jgi:hypothetical protein
VAKARFTPNPQAAQQLASGAEMGAYLRDVADDAAGEVRRRLPYPRLLGGVRVSGTSHLSASGYEGAVVIDGPGWHLWEYGTKNHGGRPAIRPGVQTVISRVGGRWRSA